MATFCSSRLVLLYVCAFEIKNKQLPRQIDNVEKNAHWLSWCSTIRFTCLDKSSPRTHKAAAASAPHLKSASCMTLNCILYARHHRLSFSRRRSWLLGGGGFFLFIWLTAPLTPPLCLSAPLKWEWRSHSGSRYNALLKVKPFHFPLLPANGPWGK